jgi:hypothetical protein
MISDPTKLLEIARMCATLSKSAASSEERDRFAELASKWQRLATVADTCILAPDERLDPKCENRNRALRRAADQ